MGENQPQDLLGESDHCPTAKSYSLFTFYLYNTHFACGVLVSNGQQTHWPKATNIRLLDCSPEAALMANMLVTYMWVQTQHVLAGQNVQRLTLALDTAHFSDRDFTFCLVFEQTNQWGLTEVESPHWINSLLEFSPASQQKHKRMDYVPSSTDTVIHVHCECQPWAWGGSECLPM